MSETRFLAPKTPVEWTDLADAVLAEFGLISRDLRNRVVVHSVAPLVDQRSLQVEFTLRSAARVRVDTFSDLEDYASVRDVSTAADLAGWLYGELEESVLAIDEPPGDRQTRS